LHTFVWKILRKDNYFYGLTIYHWVVVV